jgi:hypothetical protein
VKSLDAWGYVFLMFKAIALGFGIAVLMNFAANVIAIALEQKGKHVHR